MKRGTRRSALNRRRKGLLAVILPWARRFGFVLGALVLLLWGGAWFFLSDADERTAAWGREQTLEITAGLGFTVKDVLIEGRTYSDPETIKALVNVRKGDPLFAFDPAEAKALIEKISWIRSAHVERRLPGTIYIRVQERKPLALWQKDGKLRLLDGRGEVIVSGDMERFENLVIVIGDDAPQNAPALLSDLAAEPLLYERTKAAQRVSGRRWDLTLDGDVRIKLPEEDQGLALRRLALAQEEEQLLDKDVTSVDLREADRMIIRTRPGAVREYKAGLNPGSDI
ncbi:MAG: FtsQ-type POTRA domain-containing protein [Alphaproteobacteria bacterium]|nr:FtsQ-type POTRA domain-containing protein [Alphaproteobacteria bacterium]